MPCIHKDVDKYSLLDTFKLPFDKNGDIYYFINNFGSDLEPKRQIELIDNAFQRWNYHLSRFGYSFKRTEEKEKAFIQIYFVAGKTGSRPEPQYEVILLDKNMIAFCIPDTGIIYINDDIDFSNEIDLAISLEHEIGHSQGIGHTNERNDIMFPDYIPENEITIDTVKALNKLYNKSWHSNIDIYAMEALIGTGLIYLIYKIFF